MNETTFIYGLFDPRNYSLRYIGKSDNPDLRLKQHMNEMKHGKKGNRHMASWIRQLLNEGLEPSIEILEECTLDNWQESEQAWIAECKKFGLNLVNVTNGGEGMVGYVPSAETRAKVSAMFKGRPALHLKGKPLSEEHKAKIKANSPHHKHTEETKKKISEGHKGRVFSDEHKRKIGEASKGRSVGLIRSEETKQKMSEAQLGPKNHRYGKKLSEEHKEVLRKVNMGRKHTEEYKAMMSEARKGKPRSEETKRKISESRKRLFEQRRNEASNQ